MLALGDVGRRFEAALRCGSQDELRFAGLRAVSSQQRLQKILSAAGFASRRAAERLILEGRVMVNGATVTELGTKADPEHDEIRVDGRRVRGPERHRYILLNKPRGYVTTRDDPQRRATVMDLLKRVRERVYPVGRLDYDSEGLLILTNDGELAARLAHPRHHIDRTYEVRIRGVPDDREFARLEGGLVIDGRRTAPADVTVLRTWRSNAGPQSLVEITIREGRNRQVRKMFDAIGHPVVRLRRVRIGPIADDQLRPGEFRDLNAREVEALKKSTAT